MTGEELLERASARAAEGGWPLPSARQIRDWRDEKLIAGPIAHGQRRGQPPNWSWSEESLETVVVLCRLRSFGRVTVDQLRSYLWISRRPITLLAARASLAKAYGGILGRMRRGWRSANLETIASREKVARRAVRIDPFLPALVPKAPGGQPPDLNGLACAMFGALVAGDRSNDQSISAFDRSIPGTQMAARINLNAAATIIGMNGLLGLEDEIDNSATETIMRATEDQFLTAREAIGELYSNLKAAIDRDIEATPLDGRDEKLKRAESLRSCDWVIILFVMMLHGLVNSEPHRALSPTHH